MAGRRTHAPDGYPADDPIDDAAGDLRAADALANWQRWIAHGKATVTNGVLCLLGPELTADEWAARLRHGALTASRFENVD